MTLKCHEICFLAHELVQVAEGQLAAVAPPFAQGRSGVSRSDAKKLMTTGCGRGTCCTSHYNSVRLALQNGDEMRQAISSKMPAKIDIGPVYNVDPQRRGAFAGRVQLRVLRPKHALHVASLFELAPIGAASRR